jgi:hypothetical protein
MTAEKVIERAAYELGDDIFEYITKDEYLRFLERAIRDLCKTAKVMKSSHTYDMTAGSKELELYQSGPPAVGDDVMSIYNIRYYTTGDLVGVRCVEQIMDDVENTDSDLQGVDLYSSGYKLYRVERSGATVKLVFVGAAVAGDTVKIWYNVLPQIGSQPLSQELSFDRAYHSDIVTGVTVFAAKRMAMLSVLGKRGLGKEAAKVYDSFYRDAGNAWELSKYRIAQKVNNFLDETIPNVIEVATPFDDLGSDTDLTIDGGLDA